MDDFKVTEASVCVDVNNSPEEWYSFYKNFRNSYVPMQGNDLAEAVKLTLIKGYFGCFYSQTLKKFHLFAFSLPFVSKHKCNPTGTDVSSCSKMHTIVAAISAKKKKDVSLTIIPQKVSIFHFFQRWRYKHFRSS